MRSSPLLLKDYFTTHLSFSAQSEFKVGDNSDAGKILVNDLKVDVQQSKQEDNPFQRSFYLTIELDDSSGTKYPCVFSISLVGFFEVAKEWPVEQVDILFNANAPALLYSAAREALATVTGRSPFKGILLPSVTFVPPPPAPPKQQEGERTFSEKEQSEEKSETPLGREGEASKNPTKTTTTKSSKK